MASPSGSFFPLAWAGGAGAAAGDFACGFGAAGFLAGAGALDAATAGFSAEVAAVVTEDDATFARLKAPVRRVCALQVPIPYSPVLEDHVFPDRKRIIEGIREVLKGPRPAAAA